MLPPPSHYPNQYPNQYHNQYPSQPHYNHPQAPAPQAHSQTHPPASHHVTNLPQNIHQTTPFEGLDQITIGNGQGLSINSSGESSFQSPFNPKFPLIYNNLLFVPVETLEREKEICISHFRICKSH